MIKSENRYFAFAGAGNGRRRICGVALFAIYILNDAIAAVGGALLAAGHAPVVGAIVDAVVAGFVSGGDDAITAIGRLIRAP